MFQASCWTFRGRRFAAGWHHKLSYICAVCLKASIEWPEMKFLHSAGLLFCRGCAWFIFFFDFSWRCSQCKHWLEKQMSQLSQVTCTFCSPCSTCIFLSVRPLESCWDLPRSTDVGIDTPIWTCRQEFPTCVPACTHWFHEFSERLSYDEKARALRPNARIKMLQQRGLIGQGFVGQGQGLLSHRHWYSSLFFIIIFESNVISFATLDLAAFVLYSWFVCVQYFWSVSWFVFLGKVFWIGFPFQKDRTGHITVLVSD